MSSHPFYANVDASPAIGDSVESTDYTRRGVRGVVESLDNYSGAANVGILWSDGERSYDYPSGLERKS